MSDVVVVVETVNSYLSLGWKMVIVVRMQIIWME